MKNRHGYTAALAGIAGFGAALALGSTGLVDAAHGGALTSGDLSGRAEVATDAANNRIVGDPNGRGEAYVFSTGGTEVCYVIEVDNIEPATAAHIHEAPAGQNGGVVATLSPPTDGQSAGCVDVATAELAADITLFESDNYYVNVHNEAYPGGAVRGQLGD